MRCFCTGGSSGVRRSLCLALLFSKPTVKYGHKLILKLKVINFIESLLIIILCLFY